jgi:hypothetical protein
VQIQHLRHSQFVALRDDAPKKSAGDRLLQPVSPASRRSIYRCILPYGPLRGLRIARSIEEHRPFSSMCRGALFLTRRQHTYRLVKRAKAEATVYLGPLLRILSHFSAVAVGTLQLARRRLWQWIALIE